MKKILFIPISLILLLSLLIPTLHAKRSDTDTVTPKIESSDRLVTASRPTDPQRSAAVIDTFVLGEWTFDGAGGGPDPQGWYGVDRTVQPGPFFHVDDFAGLGGGYSPLEGSQSMWCGARPDPVAFCTYSSLPGYGNSWNQYFESVPFPASGDVTLDYKVRYDTEAGYDYVYVQYYHKNGHWETFKTYDGQGDAIESETIPADSLDNEVQIRFWVDSDGAWDDQDGLYDSDGAIIVDNLTVSDTVETLDFQDFESESVGDLTTSDGDWMATVDPAFGDYSGLFDGTNVLQEDTNWTNSSYLWGFFNGSTDTYECDGHPEQVVVPYTHTPGSEKFTDYIHNEIWSPWIDFTNDINGMPIPWDASSVIYEFDIYTDLQVGSVIYYTFRIRSLVNDCPQRWRKWDEFYYGPAKAWIRRAVNMGDLVAEGATHVQLALSVRDWCATFCGVYGNGECHSHGPLYDNVKLTRIFESGTGVEETPSVETALHQCYPNPFNPVTTIAFSIREQAHVSLKVYNAAGQHVRTLLDEMREAGTHADVTWDGRDDSGGLVSSGVYFYRLVTGAFSQTKKMVLIK